MYLEAADSNARPFEKEHYLTIACPEWTRKLMVDRKIAKNKNVDFKYFLLANLCTFGKKRICRVREWQSIEFVFMPVHSGVRRVKLHMSVSNTNLRDHETNQEISVRIYG